MGATEVTRAQWKAVMGADAPDMGLKDQTDQHPVVGITWFEAVEFCKKLSAKEGKTYRLPTEAEWEYACRAGTSTTYSFGDKPDLSRMICENAQKDRDKQVINPRFGWSRYPPVTYPSVVPTRSSPVTTGSAPANAWGMHDMHGNVQ
jgi:formylglycine-generating enzyme required for sulfatase activity